MTPCAELGLPPAGAIHCKLKGRIGEWKEVPPPPQVIDKPWDFVIVDGPDGFDRSSPGRQIPVAWATRLARRAVYVHDYERKWETAVCEKYLGKPSEVVGAQGRNDRCLGVFRFPEDNGGSFCDPDRERPQEDRLPAE